MSYNLFLDDERSPRDVSWIQLPNDRPYVIVRNIREFQSHILSNGIDMAHISFDNDLGYNEPEGRDCVKWLVEQMLDGILVGRFTYTVHSKNVVAAAWIQQYLDRFFESTRDN